MDDATIRQILENLPPGVDVRTGLDVLAQRDPMVWSMIYRKLKGYPLTYNAARYLSEGSLQELEKALPNPEDYLRQVKMRLLRHRPFLVLPLRDQHKHKVFKKGRQMGVSELAITEPVWFLFSRKPEEMAKWVYTFPRLEQLQTFSDTRIKEIFSETPRIRALLDKSPGSRRKIGNGYLILRSAWEANLGEGIDASGVTFDEKDRMKKGIDVAFQEGLEGNAYGLLREVSTPTTPNEGIDQSFQKSDQRYWFVRCTRCNEAQPIRWTESGMDSNIVQVKRIPIGCTELPEDSYDFLCHKIKCRGKLDRMRGEWVAKYPSITKIRGYHIPQTIAPWQSATHLMQKKIKYRWLQLWLNYCLGETSTGETVLLDARHFEAISCGYAPMFRRPRGFHDISVGIDWGHQNWVVVFGIGPAADGTERPYLLGLGMFQDAHGMELEGAKQIANFIAPFDPDIIVADAGFGKDRNSYLLRRFGVGRFYACTYNPATRGSRTFQPVWSQPEKATLLVDRTMSLKDMCAAIRDGEFGTPSLEHDLVMLWKDHISALVPYNEIAENSDGSMSEDGEIVETVNSTGPDHFAHATNYAKHGLDFLSKRGHFSYDFL